MTGTYHKILTVYKRDPDNRYKTLLEGEWATPEFGYLADLKWEFTEKIDGTNIRVMWESFEPVTFRGRTDRSQIPPFLLDKLQDLFPPTKLNLVFPSLEMPVTLYGEGYGAKIQKGGGNYIPDGVSFILFDVNIGGWWLKREDVNDIAGKLGIGAVPVIGRGTLKHAVELVRSEFQSRVGNQAAEGLVMRPAVELHGHDGNRVIAKVKCRDFAR